MLQWAIEKTFRKKLSFDIRSGDIVLGDFSKLPNVGGAVQENMVKKFQSDGRKKVGLSKIFINKRFMLDEMT